MRLYGVVGWKNTGKTGLVERLVTEITGRDFTVSTVKHAHHGVDVDHPGRDSHRHREAGATEVLLSSSTRWALMHELRDGDEPPLEELLARLSPCDIVLVEGYKAGGHAKIEVRRLAAKDRAPFPASANVIAIAADHAIEDAGVPVFSLDAVAEIADFIETTAGLR